MTRFSAYINDNYSQHALALALLDFVRLPPIASQDKLTCSYGTQVLDTNVKSLESHKDLCERIESKANKLIAWFESRPYLDLTHDLILDHGEFCHGIIDNNIAQRLGYQATVKPLTSEQAVIRPATINA